MARTRGRALRRKGNDEAEPERGIGRRHDAQINRGQAQHLGIVAEQMQPQQRDDGDHHADRSREHEANQAAGPGDLSGPGDLAGADIDPHHCQHRGAEAKQNRNHHVIEPRGDAIGRERLGAEQPDRAGDQNNRQIGQHGIHRCRNSDLENIQR